jgi:hypothetical protein
LFDLLSVEIKNSSTALILRGLAKVLLPPLVGVYQNGRFLERKFSNLYTELY